MRMIFLFDWIVIPTGTVLVKIWALIKKKLTDEAILLYLTIERNESHLCPTVTDYSGSAKNWKWHVRS